MIAWMFRTIHNTHVLTPKQMKFDSTSQVSKQKQICKLLEHCVNYAYSIDELQKMYQTLTETSSTAQTKLQQKKQNSCQKLLQKQIENLFNTNEENFKKLGQLDPEIAAELQERIQAKQLQETNFTILDLE